MGQRFQILIAEESEGDVALVREALADCDLNCELVVIGDGAEVIHYLRTLDANGSARKPDLLLDMHLPKCDGEQILKDLRSTERSSLTPVVIMSSSSIAEMETMGQKHAALYYFRKPSSWPEFSRLGKIVKELLEKTQGGFETSSSSGSAAGAIE